MKILFVLVLLLIYVHYEADAIRSWADEDLLEDEEFRHEKTQVCVGGRLYRLHDGGLECCRGQGKCTNVPCKLQETRVPAQDLDVLDELLDDMDFGDEIDIGADEDAPHQSTPAFCKLPAHTGRCRAGFRRFYYHPKSKSCKRFIYGGCGSNGNNFKTQKECLSVCRPKNIRPSRPAFCYLPPVEGPISCLAYFPMYFFNKKTGQCERFIYGGCRGTKNRFSTMKECVATCGGR